MSFLKNIVVLALIVMAVSCTAMTEELYFNPGNTDIVLPNASAGSTNVFFNTNVQTVQAAVLDGSEWLDVKVYDGGVMSIIYSANDSEVERIGRIALTASDMGAEYKVTQPGKTKEPDPVDEPKEWPFEKLVGLWNHDLKLDVSGLVEKLNVNCIWTGDNMVTDDLDWEKSHLYRSSSVPGVDYVIAKVNRVAWGWTHEGSISHAAWACRMASAHDEVIGLYLNDFYDEIEEGYRTEDEWREIIAKVRETNPDLPIWVPVYPHRQQEGHAYDFDFDGVIVNMFGNTSEQIENLEQHIYDGLNRFPDKWVIAGVYLESGATGKERWLSEEDFRKVMTFYVELLNEGKIEGIRMFNANLFLEKPEYIDIAREIIDTIEK